MVERRLCACVNILPGMVSFYWWQGKVERGDEVVMIIKTRASLAAACGAVGDGDDARRIPGSLLAIQLRGARPIIQAVEQSRPAA